MSWNPKEFKKGMVSTVSIATGLTSDYGYKKSPVNLERTIWLEGRSRCWLAGTRRGLEGEDQRCQVQTTVKQFACVGKEPVWQLENQELRRISPHPAEMSGQSAIQISMSLKDTTSTALPSSNLAALLQQSPFYSRCSFHSPFPVST